MPNTKPNIFMFVIDSARYDRFGTHGYRHKLTPHMDRFAETAVDYTNANAPAGSTRPAMGAIFTGLYPQAYGLEQDKFPDEQHTTFAERLSQAGYDTYLYSTNAYVSPATGYDRGFQHVCYLNKRNIRRMVRPGIIAKYAVPLARMALSSRITLKVSCDMLVDEAVRLIATKGPSSKPFLLYVHLEVHHPYLSERKYLNKYLEPGIGEDVIREVEWLQRNKPAMKCFISTELSEEKKRQYHSVLGSMYDASMEKVDEQVALLFDAMRERNLMDGSVVAVSSDHGEFLGERDIVSHGIFPYEQAIRVPLFVKYPNGTVTPGPSDRLVSTIDTGPTYCELAGADCPRDEVQGLSLLAGDEHDFIMNQRQAFKEGYDEFKRKHPNVDWERFNLGHVWALKDKRYKYITTTVGKRFLFDLQEDPGEQHEAADKHPDLVEKYHAKFERWKAGLTVTAGSEEPEYDEAVMDHLRDLGYVE